MNVIKYVLPLLIIISLGELKAQLSIGLKAGYTNAWESYGPDVPLPENAETDVSGINISAMAYYKLGKFLSIGIEPGYVERGAACFPGFGIIFNGDTKFFLDYVEAPLMISANLPLFNKKIELYGKLGYGASMMVKAEREVTPLNDEPVTTTPIQLGPESILNRWDHGAYGGVGIGYNFGKTQVFVESNFYYGMRDAERSNVSKNRSVNVNLGVSRRIF